MGKNVAQESVMAFRRARAFSRKMYQWQEKSPAIKAIVDGVEPDQFMQKFVLGSGKDASVANVGKLMAELWGNKEATVVVKNQVAAWIKNQAQSGNADELGTITHKGLKNALDKIGDRKLDMLFGKAGINELRVIQRVASYEQAQPSASAVNNSNTTTTAIGMFVNWIDKIGSVIPGWNSIITPTLKTGFRAVEGKNLANPDIGIKATKPGVPLAAPLALGFSGAVAE